MNHTTQLHIGDYTYLIIEYYKKAVCSKTIIISFKIKKQYLLWNVKPLLLLINGSILYHQIKYSIHLTFKVKLKTINLYRLLKNSFTIYILEYANDTKLLNTYIY